jgi:hypothetical protein
VNGAGRCGRRAPSTSLTSLGLEADAYRPDAAGAGAGDEDEDLRSTALLCGAGHVGSLSKEVGAGPVTSTTLGTRAIAPFIPTG